MKRLLATAAVCSFLIAACATVGVAPSAKLIPTAVTALASKNTQELLGIDGKYDSHSVLMGQAGIEKLEAITRSLPEVKAVTKFRILPNTFGVAEEDKEQAGKAVGIFLGGRYLLTVAHVGSMEGFGIQTPFGVLPLPIKVLETRYSFSIAGEEFPLREIKIDAAQDWALFEIPEKARGKYFPPKIGKSSELKAGHFLYLVGNPFDIGFLVRNGVVEALRGDLSDLLPAIDSEDVFVLSGGIYPGDSGGPVFALRDGELELVGTMNTTKLYTNIGFALKIDPLLEKIKAATGIDLRK